MAALPPQALATGAFPLPPPGNPSSAQHPRRPAPRSRRSPASGAPPDAMEYERIEKPSFSTQGAGFSPKRLRAMLLGVERRRKDAGARDDEVGDRVQEEEYGAVPVASVRSDARSCCVTWIQQHKDFQDMCFASEDEHLKKELELIMCKLRTLS